MANQQKLKIKKGDAVIVTTGKDKGKRGEVLRVIPEQKRVVISGANVATRHNRPSQFDAGGIAKKEMPIHISNVALVDPKQDVATRVGYKTLKDGRKVRFAKKSGEVIDA